MQTQVTKFEVKKGERVYQFILENDSPLGEAHDVLLEMRQHVINTIIKSMEIQKDEIKPPQEIIQPEVIQDAQL